MGCCLKKVTMEMKLKGYFLMESKHLYKMVALKMSYIRKIIKRTQTKGKPTERETNQKNQPKRKENPIGREPSREIKSFVIKDMLILVGFVYYEIYCTVP